MAGVRIENATKVYSGNVVAVKNANLEVRDKEFLVLVGPSGCGKSTMLRMIAGLEEISEGEIAIGDRVVNRIPPKDRNVAMVFQNYALYPHMSVRTNMAFGLKIRRYPRKEIDERVVEAAKILGIEELLERRPKMLSGGQRQRVALGRAIVRHPDVFLFDEPLSNLDAKLRAGMRAELIHLHRRLATTMIYVTHDQVEAMTLGTRIVVMNEGVIQQVGTPLDVYNRPTNKFIAGFVGTPPMNFLQGRFRKSGGGGGAFEYEGQTITLPPDLVSRLKNRESRPITFGIRPENIQPASQPAGASGDGKALCAKVEVLEPLGNETLIHASISETFIVSKVPYHAEFDIDETITLQPDFSRAHLFDTDTGANLTLD